MAGFNLQTYKDHALFLLENRFQSESSPTWTDTLIFSALNEAFYAFEEVLGKREGQVSTGVDTLVSGTWRYSVPVDLVGGKIEDVRVLDSNGTWVPMERISMDRAKLLYSLGGTSSPVDGEPVHWALDAANGQLLLLPCPNRGAANGISLTHSKAPTPLHRVYSSSNGVLTASTTYGSDTVTLSGLITTGDFVVGDEFGILRTTQTDGSEISGESPRIWYKIEAITNASVTTLTLSSAFVEPTNATAGFMCAQVADLEKEWPGKLLMAPAAFAVGSLLTMDNPKMASDLKTQAVQNVWNLSRNNSSVKTAGLRSASRYSFIGRSY